MNEVMDYLFGAIGKEYCMYFYFLSVLAFIAFIIALVSVIRLMATNKKLPISTAVLVVFQPFLVYFVNRIFYSMCVNSLV